MGDYVKEFLPWMLLCIWLILYKSLHKHRAAAATLFLTIFAGFSSNFTPYYRELGQLAVFLAAVFAALTIFRRRRITRLNLIFAVFGFFIILSLTGNGVSELAITATLNFVAITFVVNFLFISLASSDALAEFMRYYAGLGSVVGICAILEWLVTGGRVEVTFSNANYLGFFLGIGACVALCFPGIRNKWIKWALISAGVYCTGSRAALVFPFLAVISLLSVGGMRHLAKASPIFLLMAAIALAVPQPPNLTGRTGIEGSDQERSTALEVGVEMIRQNPLVGVGWGKFQEEFWTYLGTSRSYFDSTKTIVLSQQRDMVSHNDFVRVFAETGVASGLLFCFLISYSFYCAFFFGKHYRPFLLAALGGMTVFSATHNNLNSSLFWYLLLLPMLIRYGRQYGSPSVGSSVAETL